MARGYDEVSSVKAWVEVAGVWLPFPSFLSCMPKKYCYIFSDPVCEMLSGAAYVTPKSDTKNSKSCENFETKWKIF